MAKSHRYVSIRPYLPHALGATAAVVGIPVAAVALLTSMTETAPSTVAVALLALGVAIGVFLVGSHMWARHPDSGDIAFGDLMIWGWLRRRSAEARLADNTRLLGLDRSGHPESEPVEISREEQMKVLRDLTAALESKDPYTHGHSRRVERHVLRTGAAMGLSVEQIEELRKAAALHDVGKIRVPDRVLRKPGQLTIEERALVEEHVVVGAWMVSSVGDADVIAGVRHHHERWDGRGYPDGLMGVEIPLYSRIIAVADAYDAMTSTRPYRASFGRDKAVDVLWAEAGIQFDPMVVEAFVAALPTRATVAGLMALFAAPSWLFRKAAVQAKRLGVGNVTPALGALGAAALMGGFIPGGGPADAPKIAIERADDPQESEVVDLSTQTEDLDPVEEVADPKPKPKPKPGAVAKKKSGPDTVVLGSRIKRGGRPTTAPSGTTTATPPTSPPAQTGQPAQPAQPTEKPKPTPDRQDDEHVPTDPQPDHGRDCDKPGDSEGNDKHCG
ncbi:MAG: HD-GYP domain-containing protein [Actinomycetota bacterium]|nr:HD-GYP domain-containing protein [Actinomycetota bacterium]